MTIQDTLASMMRHARAIQRLERPTECDCPEEADPYGTGDTGYVVRNCERPYDCCMDRKAKAEDDKDLT